MVLSQRNECNPTTRRKPSLISPPSLPAINETSSSPEDSPSKGRSAEGCGTDASPCKLYETGEGEEGGTDDDYEDDGIDRFRRRKYFLTRHGMMLHPYDHEAPYMQAYDPVSLDNDRYTETLLRRLNPADCPTFRAPMRHPRTVLDLGCGRGCWMLDAAAEWSQTKFTGFDLVDLSSEWIQKKGLSVKNITFVLGNFVNYDLPFPDDSFDLVRMANLSLCIPFDKWEFVLRQVHRVMAPGGRLEFIDDQTIFPYQPPVPPPSVSSSSLTSLSNSSSCLSDTHEGVLPDSDLIILPEDTTSMFEFPDLLPPYDLYATWKSEAATSRDLEATFERMLVKSGIHPKPYKFISDTLKKVFGQDRARKLTSMHLSLAPTDGLDGNSDSDVVSSTGDNSGPSVPGKWPWITIEWDVKEEKNKRVRKKLRKKEKKEWKALRLEEGGSDDNLSNLSLRSFFEGLSFKGDNVKSDDSKDENSVNTVPPPTRVQSQGLIVWPSTFIPFEPTELEMHVCKHMHVLLGCKPALAEFIAEFTDEDGGRLVDEAEFNDVIWQYESFLRNRFNWPSDVPELQMDEGRTRKSSDSSSFGRKTNNARVSHGRVFDIHELSHVRTIRVFEGFKPKDP